MSLPKGFGTNGAGGGGHLNSGPWTNGSNVYALSFFDDTVATLWRAVMYKATDPTSSWTAVGSSTTQANQPTVADGKGTGMGITGVQVGTKIYFAYKTGNGSPTVRWFDMSNDTWGTVTATPFSSLGSPSSISIPAIAANANGDIAVAVTYFPGSNDGYYIARCSSASLSTLGFSANLILDSGRGSSAVTAAVVPFLVGGAGGRFHGAYAVPSSVGIQFVTLNNGGTAGTSFALQTAGADVMLALATRDAGGGTIKVRGIFRDADNATANEAMWIMGDSADNLSPTLQDLGITNTVGVATLAYSPTAAAWVYVYDTSSTACSYRTINDAGTTVGAATSQHAVGLQTISPVATIYTRSSAEEMGWVVAYTTTGWAYDEVTPGGGTTPATITAAAANATSTNSCLVTAPTKISLAASSATSSNSALVTAATSLDAAPSNAAPTTSGAVTAATQVQADASTATSNTTGSISSGGVTLTLGASSAASDTSGSVTTPSLVIASASSASANAAGAISAPSLVAGASQATSSTTGLVVATPQVAGGSQATSTCAGAITTLAVVVPGLALATSTTSGTVLANTTARVRAISTQTTFSRPGTDTFAPNPTTRTIG